MESYIGVLLAFAALISWGFGDFFIQKTTRLVGSWKALFFIGIVGLIGLFPFVRSDLLTLSPSELLLLSLLGTVVVFASLFNFEALREGKISIVEPVIGLELPLTIALAITIAGESLAALQIVLIGIIFLGIILAITTETRHLHLHKRIFEKGVILAGVGAIGMALTNFLVGFSSQNISPLTAIWFAHSLLAIVCGIYIWSKGDFGSLWQDFKENPKPIISQSVLDNVAWVSYASATTYIPIAIATAISESYIALAVLLGFYVNREKLKTYQVFGILLATIGVITLSYFS